MEKITDQNKTKNLLNRKIRKWNRVKYAKCVGQILRE